MKAKNFLHKALRVSAAVIMLLALAWLTVSTPFVYASQQAKKELVKKQWEKDSKAENDAPVSNPTEEKAEDGMNSLSEYLHEHYVLQHTSQIVVKYYKCHPSDLYFAFHPELLSPPPEA